MLAKEALADPGVIDGLLHHKDVRKAEGLTAGDLMTHPAVTGPAGRPGRARRPDDALPPGQAAPGGQLRRGLVGIVSRTDVLAVFDRPDEDIRKDIVDNVILHEFLVDPRQFTVTVQAGVVTMEGTPETAALGHDLVRKARHVPGVVAVRDRLSYPGVYPVVAGPVA